MQKYHRLDPTKDLRAQMRKGLDVCICSPKEKIWIYLAEIPDSSVSYLADREKYLKDNSRISLLFLDLRGWVVDAEGRLVSNRNLDYRGTRTEIDKSHQDFSKIGALLKSDQVRPAEGVLPDAI